MSVRANSTSRPGGPLFKTDKDPADGAEVPVNKLMLGGSGSFDGFVGVGNPLPVAIDGAGLDAFGRQRVSSPLTIFDSKQIFDNQPLFWDDQEESGSGTTSTHSAAAARTRIAVAATTAGKRTRQTFMRFNYQPGKSQLVVMTGLLANGGAGITAGMGLYDDNNGIFVRSVDGVMQVVRRTSTSGSAVDNAVAQSAWNVDPMDGTGPSGITLDPSTTQIFFLDIEWLGVGRVRCGWVVDGQFYVCHQFLNTNSLTEVYMSTANLPLRYQIENDGTGGTAYVDHICSTVISEGGVQDLGVLRWVSTAGTHIDANAADTLYGVIGIRLKSTAIGATVKLTTMSLLAQTNDNFEWQLVLNPTVAGSPTFSDQTNSSVQTVVCDNTNTVTGGIAVAGGFVQSSSGVTEPLENAILLGASIAGDRDTIYLCARPLTSNSDIEGGLGWREIS